MAGPAAATAGRRTATNSRPTTEEQVASLDAATARSMKARQENFLRAQQQNAQLHGHLDPRQQQAIESVIAKTSPAGAIAVGAKRTVDDIKGFGRRAFSTVMSGGAKAAGGIGFVGGFAAAKTMTAGRAGANVMAGAREQVTRKATGTVLILLIAIIVHIFDIRYGFPRGGGVPGFAQIVGGYVTLIILWRFFYRMPLRDGIIYALASISIPWILQLSLNFAPIAHLRQTMTWAMILATPFIWNIYGNTDQERDPIAQWVQRAHVIFIVILLVPAFTAILGEVSGPQTAIAAEATSKDIGSQFYINFQNYIKGVGDFINGVWSGVGESVSDKPPDGTTNTRAYVIGLVPDTTTETVIHPAESGTAKNVNINLQVVSPDNLAFVFENKCRIKTNNDNDKRNDVDEDGMVDWDSPTWTSAGKTTLPLTSSQTIFCDLLQINGIQSIFEDKDSATVQFGTRYDVKVAGTYTTYFIKASYDEETGYVNVPYGGGDLSYRQDFYTDKPSLDPSPKSEATNAPCFLTIDNNDDPSVNPNTGPPYLLYGETDVPLRIGFSVKGTQGQTIIEGIKDMRITAPEGVTDIVCDNDPNLVTKESDGVFRVNTESRAFSSPRIGRPVILNCLTKIDPDIAIKQGDYAVSSFEASATCTMVNTADVKVRINRPVDEKTGTSLPFTYGGVWDRWPVEASNTDCYGPRTLDGKPSWHDGVDFGTGGRHVPIVAVADGVVDRICLDDVGSAGKDCSDNGKNNYGIVVIVKHSSSFYTFYAHMNDVPDVVVGQTVKAGTQLGVTGETGYSKGIHLHFGIAGSNGKLTNGGATAADVQARDPSCYLPKSYAGNTLTCTPYKGCPASVSGGSSGQEQEVVRSFASQLGIPFANAWAIALTEGGGKHWDSDGSVKLGDGGKSHGMMQIYLTAHPECAGTISGTSCMGAQSCAGKTIDDLSCNVEAGLRLFASHHNAACSSFSGWDAAAGRYNGCCANGCSVYLSAYHKNGGTA